MFGLRRRCLLKRDGWRRQRCRAVHSHLAGPQSLGLRFWGLDELRHLQQGSRGAVPECYSRQSWRPRGCKLLTQTLQLQESRDLPQRPHKYLYSCNCLFVLCKVMKLASKPSDSVTSPRIATGTFTIPKNCGMRAAIVAVTSTTEREACSRAPLISQCLDRGRRRKVPGRGLELN